MHRACIGHFSIGMTAVTGITTISPHILIFVVCTIGVLVEHTNPPKWVMPVMPDASLKTLGMTEKNG